MPTLQPRILIVDDEAAVRDSLRRWFELEGYAIALAENGAAALHRLQQESFDVALVDLKMPGMDGVALQQRMHEVTPDTAVIIVTAYGTIQSAVEVLKHGAFDYVTKPVDPDELSRLVHRALELRELRLQNARLRQTIDDRGGITIVGESVPMRQLRAQIDAAARTDSAVLITGESGSGKHLVATAIHAASARRYFSFVPLHCGASGGALNDAELLGQEAGSLPQAQFRRMGKLQLAEGGTLFLDEVGRLSKGAQQALIEVLRSGSFTPLGGGRARPADFRLIAASSVPMLPLVEGGHFDADLYYRLAVLTLSCPPLRERPGDIPLLARHLLQRDASGRGLPFDDFTPEALERLQAQRWPGNVRELANAIERARVAGDPPLVRAEDLPPDAASPPELAPGELSLALVEQRHIARVLERCSGDRSRAAVLLGIARDELDAKLATPPRSGVREG